MKRATMKNQHAKNNNARVAFTIAGGYSVASLLEGRNSNSRYSTDADGMKQAGAIMPKIRLNSNNSTCYKSALSVAFNQFLEQSKHE